MYVFAFYALSTVTFFKSGLKKFDCPKWWTPSLESKMLSKNLETKYWLEWKKDSCSFQTARVITCTYVREVVTNYFYLTSSVPVWPKNTREISPTLHLVPIRQFQVCKFWYKIKPNSPCTIMILYQDSFIEVIPFEMLKIFSNNLLNDIFRVNTAKNELINIWRIQTHTGKANGQLKVI